MKYNNMFICKHLIKQMWPWFILQMQCEGYFNNIYMLLYLFSDRLAQSKRTAWQIYMTAGGPNGMVIITMHTMAMAEVVAAPVVMQDDALTTTQTFEIIFKIFIVYNS